MRAESLLLLLLALLTIQLARAATEPPSLALLEFLGSLVVLDEAFIDPLEFDDTPPVPAAEEAFGWGDWLETDAAPESGSAEGEERPGRSPDA